MKLFDLSLISKREEILLKYSEACRNINLYSDLP